MPSQIPEAAVWVIFLLPIFSFVIISFVIRPFLNDKPKLSGYTTIASISISLLLSLWALDSVLQAEGYKLEWASHPWVPFEGASLISVGLMMDSLTVIMLLVVTIVSLLVQIYSQGYMHGDAGYCRYFAFMSLFTGSMLGLVLADNLVQLYVFWELVGLCSYLLIGFWFHRPAAAAAAKKAFIVTRLGDFGFLAAILFLYFKTQTLDIAMLPGEIQNYMAIGAISTTALTWVAIGIFAGAVGKSAQFPLHVCLPDAMEGPTPVSALIHAATMVAAGVFLVARLFPIFTIEGAGGALTTVAAIGGFTAIFAATMALVMNDIKRVLAYCTISQLGYMMLGLGVGGMAFAIFHLFNHAFCKALLFLGAGSINHATGTFDMREMGGLRRVMPWTYATFLIASISMAGIWPLACFWSKDEILAQAWNGGQWNDGRLILFYLAMITVFMTAFYMFRMFFVTFGGSYRGAASHDEHHTLHESPAVMVIPLVILAVLALGSGWFNFIGGGFSEFLAPGAHGGTHGFFKILAHPLPLISLVVALLGVFLAYAMYSAKWLSPELIRERLSPVHALFSRKYWLDELYEQVIVVRILVNGLFHGLHWFDTHVVDRAVNEVAQGTVAGGNAIRRAQTGQLQAYGLAIFVGVLVIVGCFYLFA
jgi:NADH-quinone oxidoreductase subunit L